MRRKIFLAQAKQTNKKFRASLAHLVSFEERQSTGEIYSKHLQLTSSVAETMQTVYNVRRAYYTK